MLLTRLNVKRVASSIVLPAIAILLAMVVGMLFIGAIGTNPFTAYSALFQGAFGNIYSLTEVFIKMAPLLLVSLGYCMCYSMNVIALGGEGQILIGGLTAAMLAIYLEGLSPFFVIPVCIMGSFLAGALWSSYSAIMYIKRNLNIVVNSIMMNNIALLLITFCIFGPFRDPNSFDPQTAPIPHEFRLPILISKTRLHLGVVLALLVVVGMYFLMKRMPFGVSMQACGLNRTAARYAGFAVNRTILKAILLAGGLAGLAGGFEVLGVHDRVYGSFSMNYGWDAVAVCLLGRMNPIGVVFSSFFYAVLKVGASSMQRAVQIPAILINVIQAISVFFILASGFFEQKENVERVKRFFLRHAK